MRIRRAVLAIGSGAFAILAAGCGSTASTHGAGGSNPSAMPPSPVNLDCPARLAGAARTATGLSGQRLWEPAPPTGVDTGGKLTPADPPAAVVVCAYQGGEPADAARTELRGDLGRVTADLSQAGQESSTSHACLTYLASSDFQNFLIGLSFPGGGAVWVAAYGNHCAGSSNGDVVSRRNLRADAQAAFRAGYWDTDPSATAGCDAASDRSRDNEPIVPAGVDGVQICIADRTAGGWRAYPYPDDPDLVRAINETYRGEVAPVGCVVPSDGSGALVTFRYPDRAPAIVAVTTRCANGVPVSLPPASNLELLGDIEFFHVGRL